MVLKFGMMMFWWYVKGVSNNDAIDGQEDFYHKTKMAAK
jgi:hypothetical protein